MYDNEKNVTYFVSFGIGQYKKFIGNENITTNVYRVQPFGSTMCEYVCTGFIDFMLKGKIYFRIVNIKRMTKKLKSYFRK